MRRILVTGASGFLGSRIVPILCEQGNQVIAACGPHSPPSIYCHNNLSKEELRIDLTTVSSIESAFRSAAPDAVVHAAAMADLEPCERDKTLARAVNTEATYEIAKRCKENNARMIFLSTDQVFSGKKGDYREEDPPDPIHEYGRTKAAAEKLALEALPLLCTVIRVSLVYGTSPTGRRSCSEQVINALREGRIPRLFTDEIRNPISAEDVASAVSEMIERSQGPPLLHLGGAEPFSRYQLGKSTAEAYGYSTDRIEAIRQADLEFPTPRPPDLSLDTSLARRLLTSPPRALKNGLARLAKADQAARNPKCRNPHHDPN